MRQNKPRQIVALGGGMFSMEPDNGILDKYLLNLVPKKQPKICFLATASNDGEEYIKLFYDFFRKQNCIPTHLPLNDPPKNLEEFVMKQDIIHVGGGNTKLIMQLWKKSGLDKIMLKAYESGIIMSGMSAGAICWFEDGFMSGPKDTIKKLSCLGLLEGSFCPHYDERVRLRSAFIESIDKKIIKPGYGVEDGVALHFVNEELIRIVSSRLNAKAYHVTQKANRITETPLESSYLGDGSIANKLHEQDLKKIRNINLVLSFVNAINDHNVSAILEHLSEDHLFRDSIGINVCGIEDMREAWESCFMLFPDYKINYENIVYGGDEIAIYGIASGTVFTGSKPEDHNHWAIPASWKAVIKENKIAEWRVYADIDPIRKIRESVEEELDELNINGNVE